MKHESGIAVYFWVLLLAGIALSFQGRTVEASVMGSAAGIIGALNLIAREYFTRPRSSATKAVDTKK